MARMRLSTNCTSTPPIAGAEFGRQAMEFAEGKAREMGVNVLHLEVDDGNDPALELYLRTGFEDHDRFLMTKWLDREDH
jgi:ribosomal protein S18 acetylase RimI-like enzyme